MPYEQESMEYSFLQWGLKRETTKIRVPRLTLDTYPPRLYSRHLRSLVLEPMSPPFLAGAVLLSCHMGFLECLQGPFF